MRRGDELDATLAKHFAWSFIKPGDTALLTSRLQAAEAAEGVEQAHGVDADVHGPASVDDLAPDDGGARSHEKARAACRPLAAAVADAWAMDDDTAAARATKRLLLRADRLGVALVGMDAHPAEGVRLLRLLVRYGSKMTRRQRERVSSVATMVPLVHAETTDLFVEVARAADGDVARALLLDEDEVPDVGDEVALVTKLADVVDNGTTHACRATAIDLLARFERREAAFPALRRALRLPSFAVRARALHALATAHPCAVIDEDIVNLLRDLVAHAPPDAISDEDHEEDERTLADAVLVARWHARC
jgi:hypothetical protein